VIWYSEIATINIYIIDMKIVNNYKNILYKKKNVRKSKKYIIRSIYFSPELKRARRDLRQDVMRLILEEVKSRWFGV